MNPAKARVKPKAKAKVITVLKYYHELMQMAQNSVRDEKLKTESCQAKPRQVQTRL